MWTCPTCGSARCGNHAACARRREAEAVREAWRAGWVFWFFVGVGEVGVRLVLREASPIQRLALMAGGMENLRVRCVEQMMNEIDKRKAGR